MHDKKKNLVICLVYRYIKKSVEENSDSHKEIMMKKKGKAVHLHLLQS